MAQQVWAVNSQGGFLANPRISKQIRHAAQPIMRFRQFTQVKEAFGRKRGDTVLFDKIANLAAAGGSIAETSTIPETTYTIKQGSLVVAEFGQAVPYTGKLEALAEFDVEDITMRTLRDSMAKTLDSQVAIQFTSTKIKAVATSTASTVITSNGTFTATAGANLSATNVRDIVDDMKKRNVPKFDGEHYICIASVNAMRGLYDALETIQQYTESGAAGIPMGNLYAPFRGERGRYYGVRFIEENNFLSNAKGSSTNKGEAVFFGADAVMEAIVVPEEIRAKIPTDYGRDKGLAWYAMLGFQRIWDQTNDTEDHIVHLGSV